MSPTASFTSEERTSNSSGENFVSLCCQRSFFCNILHFDVFLFQSTLFEGLWTDGRNQK